MRLRFKTAFVRSLIGLAIGLVLMYLAIRLTDTQLLGAFSQLDTTWLTAGFCLHGMALFLLAYRWFLLLRCQEVFLPLTTVLRLTMVGAFFNLLIPGPVSGDLAKGILVSDPRTERRAEAAISILLDRIVGVSMLGIFTLAALGLWLLHPTSPNPAASFRGDSGAAIFWILLPFGVIVVAATVIWPFFFPKVIPILGRLAPRSFRSITSRVLNAIDTFRSSPATIIKTALLTLWAHVLFIAVLWAIATGINRSPVGVVNCFIAFQAGSVLSTIPLTPGGIGVRDLGMALTLELLQPDIEGPAAIAIVISGIIVVWRLIGGLFFLWTVTLGTAATARHIGVASTGEPNDD